MLNFPSHGSAICAKAVQSYEITVIKHKIHDTFFPFKTTVEIVGSV